MHGCSMCGALCCPGRSTLPRSACSRLCVLWRQKAALRFVWKADCASGTVSAVSQRRESSLLSGSSWRKSIQNCSHVLDLGFADSSAGAEDAPSAPWLSTLVWLRCSVAKGVEVGEKGKKRKAEAICPAAGSGCTFKPSQSIIIISHELYSGRRTFTAPRQLPCVCVEHIALITQTISSGHS